MSEWLLLAIAAVLVLANSLFVAVEFAYITVDRNTVERRAADGDKRSATLVAGLKTLSTQLSGAQLGITVTSLLVGALAEPSLATLLRGPLGLTGVPDAAVVGLSLTLALILVTYTQMIFGELVPKNWAIAEPLRVGRLIALPQHVFATVAGPVIRFLNGAANIVLRMLGIEPREELASARTAQELSSLVDRSEQEGTLDRVTAELVMRSIEFGRRSAGDVMTPRPRVHFVDVAAPVADVIAQARATGHGRFPVTGEGVDDVVGFVHFKHAVAVPFEQRSTRLVRDIMIEPTMVAESMELDPLLRDLRRQGLQMAVVVDEYGGTAGLVTLEDLLEEIVGDIEDEHDHPEQLHVQAPDGTWTVSGLLRPDEVSDLVGVELPEGEESDTLGGLVTETLGRLPEAGDTVRLRCRRPPDSEDLLPQSVDVEAIVARMEHHRVAAVRLRIPSTEAVEGDSSSGEERDE
ncbi:hemolysin family protein [Georgenia halophila]|uniref:Hemolysin family protein n=1 Tax=Georgenia halophila TaxID=620889 RepID=A0ABP8KUU5_9MICO